MENKKGFTLIELLVVVLIIGILASVALPQYFKTVEKSRSVEALSVISSLAGAQEREYMRNNAYVAAVKLLDIEVKGLKYFEAPVITVAGGITPTRNADVPTYGKYTITMTISDPPGSATPVWSCTPVAEGCATFLPKQ